MLESKLEFYRKPIIDINSHTNHFNINLGNKFGSICILWCYRTGVRAFILCYSQKYVNDKILSKIVALICDEKIPQSGSKPPFPALLIDQGFPLPLGKDVAVILLKQGSHIFQQKCVPEHSKDEDCMRGNIPLSDIKQSTDTYLYTSMLRCHIVVSHIFITFLGGWPGIFSLKWTYSAAINQTLST